MVKRALLIGCNYIAFPPARLNGCINDIVNVRNVLIDAYGYAQNNIVILRDDQNNASAMPTRANILAALTGIFAKSTANDEVWIHYSGHGTQIRDTNGDESDGADEAIVPCDFNVSGMIVDDTLFDFLKTAKCRTLLFFDSCHSGTVCDLQYIRNYGPSGIKTTINNTRAITNQNIIMMSGCRDEQTSADTYNTMSALAVGAFTTALLESLRMNDHSVDIKKLHSDTCSYLKTCGYAQIPALSSTAQNPLYTFARNNVAQTLRVVPSVQINSAQVKRDTPFSPTPAPTPAPTPKTSPASVRSQIRSVMRSVFLFGQT